MNRRYLILAALAFVAVVWFTDPLLLVLFGVGPLIWIGLPTSLIAVGHLLDSIRKGRSRRPALKILTMVAVFGCLVGVAIPTNRFIFGRAVAAAKDYPARVAPLLEAYRQAHGSYPTSLDQLPDKPAVPRLLRRAYGYRSDGSRYSFGFPQPGGIFNHWDYNSETQTWRLST